MSKDRLERIILKFKPLKDDKGRYIPFCNFGWHQGLIRNPKICEKRHCNHYYKFYIKELDRGPN